MTTTRTIDWRTLVRKADRDFDQESRRPVVYETSNGRQFREKGSGPYGTSTST